MQINRLFEIVYILLGRRSITAKELAEKFEVSARTIYRDVETLCAAGIPVYMSKGKGGGIKLLENFVLNKSILSDHEQNEILTALQSLKVISYPEVDDVISKLGVLFNKSDFNWIDVDFSDWGNGHKDQFNQLRKAIMNAKVLSFDYYNSYGEKTSREAAPLQLWFKHRSWYLKAFCLSKQEPRVFKLTRIKNMLVTEKSFNREQFMTSQDESIKDERFSMVSLKLQLQASASYRVYDEFDDRDITKNEDGTFQVTVSYPEDEWVYGYILSFGSKAEVIEPQHIREIIKNRLEEALKIYQ